MRFNLLTADAPVGTNLVTVSAAAFKKWMGSVCKFEKTTFDNPSQEVYYINKSTIIIGESSSIANCHITAMLTGRSGGDCRNFHFKIEFGKSNQHYWHYRLYHNPTTGNFVWGADRGTGATNMAGDNIYDVERECSKYSYMAWRYMNRKKQEWMLRVLKRKLPSFNFAGNRLA